MPCHRGEIYPEVLLGFNATVEENLDSHHSHHENDEEEREYDDDINSICIELEQSFGSEILIQRLQNLVWEAL